MSKKKYISPSTAEYCTASQYIAELMVTRLAHHKCINLPYKFWNTPEWKKLFKQELIKANALLKIYEPEAIIGVLHRKENEWIHSLLYPRLNDMILEEQRKLDLIESRVDNTIEFTKETITQPLKPFGKKSKISKLRELDNEEE